jgi:hypothetical protein
MARLAGWIAIALAALAGWAATGMPVADWMAARGWFGTCFEGSCGYAAVFVFLPAWTLGGTVLTLLAVWWWRRRGAGPR